uniref:Transposase for insertion sequence element IS1106 n=1 Tax=Neisseria meningitidis alpha275 TaxID=295996 RepID=C6SLW0_NEIME|nr:Transposase for insertion sequence element IS1106 [Neisseria meningitidis alpha275]
MPYYLYCLRLRRLVLIFVNPLYVRASVLYAQSKMPSEAFSDGIVGRRFADINPRRLKTTGC